MERRVPAKAAFYAKQQQQLKRRLIA